MANQSSTDSAQLSPLLIYLMAITTGVTVASNYYAQPLLDSLAAYFHVSHALAGNLVTTAQVGYGLGLLLLIPLADIFERRKLTLIMLAISFVGLLISMLASHIFWLFFGTAITAVSSVVAQVLVPFAATLAAPTERGKVIGKVMGGLLLGILGARIFSGTIATVANWRWVYDGAAALTALTGFALMVYLPRYQAKQSMRYSRLILSVLALFKTEPLLIYRSLLGLLSFALFSMFWTSMAFLLAGPAYNFNDAVIGSFGLVGAAGVMAAGWAGKLADSGKGQLGTLLGAIGLVASWVVLYVAPFSLTALIIGVILLDLCVQLIHVSNQNVIFSLRSEVRNRLNSGYMTCYFIGGALGSLTSVSAFQWGGWSAVSAASIGLSALTVIICLFRPKAKRQ